MPIYAYKNPDTGEIKEVVQTMNEKHEYFENEIEWKRVFTPPNVAVSFGQKDPFSKQAFIDKTGSMNGTVGDMIDLSQEMSDKRAEIAGGEDPLSKKKKKTNVNTKLETKDISVDYGNSKDEFL